MWGENVITNHDSIPTGLTQRIVLLKFRASFDRIYRTCWFIAYFGPNLPPKYPPNKQPNIWPRLILLAEKEKKCGIMSTYKLIIDAYQTRSTHHWLLPALVKRMRFDYFWNVSKGIHWQPSRDPYLKCWPDLILHIRNSNCSKSNTISFKWKHAHKSFSITLRETTTYLKLFGTKVGIQELTCQKSAQIQSKNCPKFPDETMIDGI